jgi:zinc/manganese transport system ATP-binding protein
VGDGQIIVSSAITLENLTVRYGSNPALQNISGVFHTGSLTAIAGPNGAGKSTLLKTIMGNLRPVSGRVIIDGTMRIAYMPQMTSLQRDFPFSVLQGVCTGFWNSARNMGGITTAMRVRASLALDEVGLGGFEKRQISTLSGGQFQRMLFARAIVQEANLILLDEPFASVDAATTQRLIQLILKWHEQGRTVVCVLHDLLLIQKYFPNSFVLAGKCLGHGHTHELLEKNLLSFDLDMAELCAGPEADSHHQHDAHDGHNHA